MAERDPSLHVLQHALGLDDYGRGKAYRNHYVATEGHHSWALLLEHEAAGRMLRRGPHDLFGGGKSYCFAVTEAGIAYVREHSPTPPKISRAKARYLEWLNVSDVYPDLTFGEWLKRGCKP